MSAMVSYVAPLVPSFPAGVDARWETENRTVWNEQEHASEELELVYEISWIAELGVWRRFLRSRGRRGTRDVMSCETRAISNLARSFIGITLLGAMLLGAARVPAQETGQKHGSVKGTVSLVNAAEERSTAE